ncbi:hypothetical protein vseg_010419 [Gypsophila vaccaria]
MAKWSDLPLDVWTKIAESIHYYEDFTTYGKVCSVWRTAMKFAKRTRSSTHVPLLLLAESTPCTSKRRFYSLYNQKVLSFELPKPSTTRGQAKEEDDDTWCLSLLFPPDKDEDGLGDWRYFCSRGWLICVTQIGLNITLINPISKQVIQPPAFPDHIMGCNTNSWHWNPKSYIFMFSKFVLSENPSTSNHYILAMIFPSTVNLAFWKNGDKEWTFNTLYSQFVDITFFRGEFYAVEQYGKIIALGNSSPPATPRLVADFMFPYTFCNSSYLVESAGKLLFVWRELEDRDEITVDLRCFKVWEINVDTGDAEIVTNLGNRALFLGNNSSFSVEACPPVSKSNCIYYTDNYHHNHLLFPEEITRCDMGVYDLSVGRKIEDFYQGPSCLSSSTLPLWVETP